MAQDLHLYHVCEYSRSEYAYKYKYLKFVLEYEYKYQVLQLWCMDCRTLSPPDITPLVHPRTLSPPDTFPPRLGHYPPWFSFL